jgi:hypothetical protein
MDKFIEPSIKYQKLNEILAGFDIDILIDGLNYVISQLG